jgi:hypothetical protein
MCSVEHLVQCICNREVPVTLDLANVYPDAVLVDRGSREALRVPGVGGSQVSRQSANEGGKFVSPSSGRLYP